MKDWKQAGEYAFTMNLTREQWAWEFLRRNPGYQEDYQWFITTWQALEQAYGKPPHRDFGRWKNDPRASRSTSEIVPRDPGHVCASDGEDALIECWMGQKWGFYKFPIDPKNDHPVPGEELLWRVPEPDYHVLDESEIAACLDNDEKVAMGFDLTLPLGEQVDHARRLLAILQRQLRKSRPEKMKNVTNLTKQWRIYLRILDALSQGISLTAIQDTLSEENLGIQEETIQEAIDLMRYDYRKLLLIPEK